MRLFNITIIVLLICLNSVAQTNEKIAVEEAQAQYDEILQAIEYNRAARIKLENQLEQNRITLRRAKQASSQDKIELAKNSFAEYEVIQNAIYENMSQGTQPGYSVYIPKREADGIHKLFVKNIDKEFKAYMKNYSVGKVKRKRGEIFFDNIIIPEINAMPLDVYSSIHKEADGITLKTYFYNGTNFIDFSEENNATANAKNILVHFAKAIHKVHLEDEIAQQQKELKRAENDLENEHKTINRAREEILENEAKISEAMQNISDKENEIDELRNQIDATRAKISKIGVN